MKTIQYLNSLGFPYSCRGSLYLSYILDNANITENVTSMYIDVAKKYNTSPSCVERNIRTAIRLYERFSNSDHISNREFIMRELYKRGISNE